MSPGIVAARELQMLGLHRGELLQARAKTWEMKERINEMRRVIPDILDGLRKGKKIYSEFGTARQFVEANYSRRDTTQGDYFEELKGYAYGALPFPQEGLCYPNPEPKYIDAVEVVRKRAFSSLNRWFNPVPDEKGAVAAPRPLTQEESEAATQLCYSGGALFINGRVVYFSELLKLWRSFGNEQTADPFLRQLTHQVEEAELQVAEFKQFSGERSFRDFLAKCSIEVVGKNLGVKLTPALKAHLLRLFLDDEELRSDLCYFTANLPLLYQMDFSKLKRPPSEKLLLSLQIFLFMVQSHGVEAKNQPALLDMVIHRGAQWNLESLRGFQHRQWNDLDWPRRAMAFQPAWERMESLLGTIAGRRVSLSQPSEEDQKLFKDPLCWPLFSLLWQTETHQKWNALFTSLTEEGRFSLSIRVVYEFCKANGSHLNLVEHCAQQYRDILGMLRVGVQHAENLFLDPPVICNEQEAATLSFATERTRQFIARMDPYPQVEPAQYMRMLRVYIHYPSELLFDLLADAKDFGIENISKELLAEVLIAPHAPFAPGLQAAPRVQSPMHAIVKVSPIAPDDRNPAQIAIDAEQVTEDRRNKAKAIARKIQETYGFSDQEIFFLYLEIIRLLVRGQEEHIGLISRVVHELVDFCPVLNKKEIYFLFLYHPAVTLEQVAALQVRVEEAKVQQDRVEEFVRILSAPCTDPHIQNVFENGCLQSLLSAFFPPAQPFTDSLRIQEWAQEGVIWTSRSLNTQVGMVKPILDNAPLAVYFHREKIGGIPVFFLSFHDTKKRTAYSAFLPLWAKGDGRTFYDALVRSCHIVFVKEEIIASEMASNELDEEQNKAMLEFLERAKKAYSTCFRGFHFDSGSSDPLQVAAQGDVYQFLSHPRGSLLPLALFRLAQVPEGYLPDASVDFVERVRQGGLFMRRQERPEPLNLELVIAQGFEDRLQLPISYRVRLLADSIPKEEPKPIKPGEVDPHQTNQVDLSVQLPGRLPVSIPMHYPFTLLADPVAFQTRFDYHNFLLKAWVYYYMVHKE